MSNHDYYSDNQKYVNYSSSDIKVRRGSDSTGYYSAISLVFLILLSVAVFKILTNSGNALTFTGFLQGLQTAPRIDVSSISVGITNVSSWLQNIPIIGGFLAFSTQIIGVIIYACSGIAQIVIYFVWFVQLLFV